MGHILMEGNSGGKEGSNRGYGREGGEKGKKVGDKYKANCHIGVNTNKKRYIYNFNCPTVCGRATIFKLLLF